MADKEKKRDPVQNAMDKIDTVSMHPIYAADIARLPLEGFVKHHPGAPGTHGTFKAQAPSWFGKGVGGLAEKGWNAAVANPLNKVQKLFKPKTFDKIRAGYRFYGRGMNALGLGGLALGGGHLAYTLGKSYLDNKKQQAPKTKTAHLRVATEMEIPYLYDLCCRYKKEFVINSKTAHALTADRLLHQDTYIAGQGTDIQGFINGGYRPLNEKNAYYIRFVYVDPHYQGSGLAKSMINELMNSKQASEGYWIQICRSNVPMQKVASALGFELIDEWDQGTDITGIWYRE